MDERDDRTEQIAPIDASRFKDVQQFGGFGLDKKRRVLELFALKPNLTEAARVLGHPRQTVEWHLKHDPEFAKAFQQVREGLCDQLEDRVYEYGQRPQNFMDRIAYLRAYRPDRWNPNKETPAKLDVTVTHRLATTASQYIDTTATVESGETAPLDRADKAGGTP